MRMLRQLTTCFGVRPATTTAARLKPAELQAILKSLPEVAHKLRARQFALQSQPRSVCTSLKDLCEL